MPDKTKKTAKIIVTDEFTKKAPASHIDEFLDLLLSFEVKQIRRVNKNMLIKREMEEHFLLIFNQYDNDGQRIMYKTKINRINYNDNGYPTSITTSESREALLDV